MTPDTQKKSKILCVGKNHEMMRILIMGLRQRNYSPVPVTSLSAALQLLDYSGLAAVIIDMAHLDFEMAAIFGALHQGISDRGLPACAIVPDDLMEEESTVIAASVPALIVHKGNLEDTAMRAVRNIQVQSHRTTIIRRRRGPKILSLKIEYYPLPEVMQFLEQRRSDGLLELIDDQHECHVFYKAGTIYHACVDDQIMGLDAIHLMLHMKNAGLSFFKDTQTDKHTIDSGTTMLLLDALRRHDEARNMLEEALAKRERRAQSSKNKPHQNKEDG